MLSTGSAAVDAGARPTEVPNQYQLITVRRDGFTRYARQYALGQRRWIGDTRISQTGSDWRDTRPHQLTDVDTVFPPPDRRRETRTETGWTERRHGTRTARPARGSAEAAGKAGQPAAVRWASPAARNSLSALLRPPAFGFPGATVTERPEAGYLRVSHPLPGGGAEQQPVGVIDGPATEAALDTFVEKRARQVRLGRSVGALRTRLRRSPGAQPTGGAGAASGASGCAA